MKLKLLGVVVVVAAVIATLAINLKPDESTVDPDLQLTDTGAIEIDSAEEVTLASDLMGKQEVICGTNIDQDMDGMNPDIVDDWARSMRVFKDVKQAASVYGFSPEIPEPDLIGEVEEVCVPTDSDQVELNVYFSSGMWLQTSSTDPLLTRQASNESFQTSASQFKDDEEKGYLLSDKTPELVEVGGEIALGVGSGTNRGRAPGSRPGFIKWWDNGITYTIYGGTELNEISIDDLIEMANSAV